MWSTSSDTMLSLSRGTRLNTAWAAHASTHARCGLTGVNVSQGSPLGETDPSGAVLQGVTAQLCSTSLYMHAESTASGCTRTPGFGNTSGPGDCEAPTPHLPIFRNLCSCLGMQMRVKGLMCRWHVHTGASEAASSISTNMHTHAHSHPKDTHQVPRGQVLWPTHVGAQFEHLQRPQQRGSRQVALQHGGQGGQ